MNTHSADFICARSYGTAQTSTPLKSDREHSAPNYVALVDMANNAWQIVNCQMMTTDSRTQLRNGDQQPNARQGTRDHRD